MVAGSLATLILNSSPEQRYETSYSKTISTLEEIILFFFSFEYGIRLLCSPKKWEFLINKTNMLDLVATIPVCTVPFMKGIGDVTTFKTAAKHIKLFAILRLWRTYKV